MKRTLRHDFAADDCPPLLPPNRPDRSVAIQGALVTRPVTGSMRDWSTTKNLLIPLRAFRINQSTQNRHRHATAPLGRQLGTGLPPRSA